MRHDNNFDLIRLVAACLVALVHLKHGAYFPLMVENGFTAFLHTANRVFPGVPVFFILSGFLITMSWRNRPDLRRFAWSRFLRIYPAYLACLVLTVGLLFLSEFSATWDWVLAQSILIAPLHTPPSLLGFGGEMVNGSLWTVPVEASFYVIAPFLLRERRSAMALLTALSFAIYALDTSRSIYWSIFPQFWWFGMGSLAFLWWGEIQGFIRGKAWAWVPGYAAFYLSFAHSGIIPPHIFEAMLGVILCPVILSLGYTFPSTSRFLKGDISYGIYLYHTPIVHTAYALGFIGIWPSVVSCILVIGVSLASWLCIEKPCLSLKQKL